ncbi:MAG: hypothetical protein JXR27_12930 [Paludibacteraceae bacterium]|nr:hypothetical protein [Paludibacteraceae bacterium]
MRKLFTLFFVLLSFALTTSLMAQNLIAGWSGNGVTGPESMPNLVGWTNTNYASIPWAEANTNGGCRFRDAGSGYTSGAFTNEVDASVNDGRQLMLRYDASAYSTSIYGFPVELDANKSYTFTVDFLIGGSATAPKTLTIGASVDSANVELITSTVFTTSNSVTVYRKAELVFKTGASAGTHYITFKGDWAWYGITNLTLEESPDQLDELNTQWAALDLGDLSEVTEDLTLPTTLGAKGVTVRWASSNSAVIDTLGVVTRPEKYNKAVTLTATVSLTVDEKLYSLTKTFKATVLGFEPTPIHVAAFDFSAESITYENDTLRVIDTQSGFKGKLMNEARIRTIGSTEQINVLDLGDGTGYFDMGQEIGQAIYSLQDFSMMGFYRVDENNTTITSGGNYYWNFSNSADVGKFANGFMYGRLNAHAAGISAAGSPSIAVNPNQVAASGKWNHFAYSQIGTVGTVYVNGLEVAQRTDMPVVATTISKDSLAGTICNWLGRSGWVNDAYLKQTLLYDFRIYSVPLSANDITDGFEGFDPVNVTIERLDNAYAENSDYIANELQTEFDQLNPGDLSNVTSNIALPTKGTTDESVIIKWSSSNPALIDADGVVTRPDYFSLKVKLTALLLKNGQNMAKTFDATVAVKEGTQFANSLLLKHDFANYAYPDTVVYDAAEKGFRAELKNDAKIFTMGATNQYKVLNLGDSIGYLDMGPEVGKLIYGLNDYTMSAYYRVDADTTLLKDAGYFLWTFSNTDDAMRDRNGYIIGSLLNQSVSITPKYYEAATGNQALGYNQPALQGDWHHFAYVQNGISAKIYLDGMPQDPAEITNLPSEVLQQAGRLGTLYNWIGRSNYVSDKYLRKTLVHDFRIYNRALDELEIMSTELNVAENIEMLNVAYSEGITSVKNTYQSDSKYKIFASEGKIKVFGLDSRDKVEIFDIAGRKLKSAVQSEIAVKPGVYIVKVNTQVTKVVVK